MREPARNLGATPAAGQIRNPDWHDLWTEMIGATSPTAVIPANAGIQHSTPLDSRIRGNDEEGGLL
jgi:hypothetical protein